MQENTAARRESFSLVVPLNDQDSERILVRKELTNNAWPDRRIARDGQAVHGLPGLLQEAFEPKGTASFATAEKPR
jgi:hypothetical protein